MAETELEVRIEPGSGSRSRLKIYHGGTHIGDYEESIEKHIERKQGEIERSADFLLDTYAEHGKFVVRWNGRDKGRRKYREGKTNPGRLAPPLGIVIPRRYWDWA